MHLDAHTLSDLASFYQRRLPDSADVIAQAISLPLPVSSSPWTELVQAAHSQNRLPRLARAVALRLPHDELAQAMARDLSGNSRWLGLGAIATAAVVLFGVGVGISLSGPAQAVPPEVAATAATADASVAPDALTAPATADADATPAVPEAPLADAAPDTLAPASRATQLAPSTRVPRAGCKAADGGRVGWWFAGSRAPGARGETITLSRGANVRAGVPSVENRWRLQPAVGCGLEAGDTVTLGEVLEIPGGVWVELRG